MMATKQDGTTTVAQPSTEDILQCQLASWYDTFRYLPSEEFKRTNVTIKTITLDLPDSFIDFLMCDGVRMPKGATKVSSCTPARDDVEWSSDEEGSDDEVEEPETFSFPELNDAIQSAIDSLGGAVMPKLNWSSPKDAAWVNLGSLKCLYAGDVYLLLKSSDFVMHDVLHAFDGVAEDEKPTRFPIKLSLRKWCNLHPSMEFRCFVFGHQLIAISQRNHTQHFPHLTRDLMLLRSQILEFFDEVVHKRFLLNNYTFDVYIDVKERIWLLDFNVWGSQTDALCFEWDELMTLAIQSIEHIDILHFDNSHPEMRVVQTENEIHHDPLASYRAPIDTVEIAGLTGGDASKFEEFMKMCKEQSDSECL